MNNKGGMVQGSQFNGSRFAESGRKRPTFEPGTLNIKPCHKGHGGKEAFTLVEVIISSMIFFIVSVGFTGGILAALKTHAMAAQHYRGTCLARNQIQHARTLAFDAVRQLQTNVWVDEQGFVAPVTNEGVFYQCTTVTNPPGMVDTVEIVVQVYFPRPFGKMSVRPIELRTMINRKW